VNNLKKEKEFNFATVLDFLLEFKWQILIVTLSAGLLAIIFSMPYFMPPKYQSTVILYPATTNSISKAILSSNQGEKNDVLALGQEEEAEQLLQILQSDEITGKVIKKYDLMKHYRINPNGAYPYTGLGREFKKNITYRRTEYMSIEISVLDESRDTAAKIANDIAAFADTAKNNVLHERARDVLAIVKQKYEEKQNFINMMVDSLGKIGASGVPPYSTQGSSSLSADYLKAVSSHNMSLAKELKTKMELQERFAPIQKSFLDRIEFENKELSSVRTNYEHAVTDAEKMLPATMIINHATPAERKAWPVRSLIVLVSMLSACTLSILFFAFLKNLREYRSGKNISGTVSIRKPKEEDTLVDA
jgi:capsular polysaccharide biosynthesis protein